MHLKYIGFQKSGIRLKARRTFIKKTVWVSTALSVAPLTMFAHKKCISKTMQPNISLAQCSLHRAIEKGEVRAVDFAEIAKKTYDISAVEYVNQFYVGMPPAKNSGSK